MIIDYIAEQAKDMSKADIRNAIKACNEDIKNLSKKIADIDDPIRLAQRLDLINNLHNIKETYNHELNVRIMFAR